MNKQLELVKQLTYDHVMLRRYLDQIRNEQYQQRVTFMQKPLEWQPSDLQSAVEKQYNELQAVISLLEGIREHVEREETELPALIGPLLAKAMRLQHKEVIGGLKAAKTLTNDTVEACWDRVLAKSYEIGYAVDRLYLLIEAHMKREDAIFELLQGVLEAETETQEMHRDVPTFTTT